MSTASSVKLLHASCFFVLLAFAISRGDAQTFEQQANGVIVHSPTGIVYIEVCSEKE